MNDAAPSAPDKALVEAIAAETGMTDRVMFVGRRFDTPELLSAMDIYALPSILGEFFPNSIVEAMCMNLPWIGSDIAGLSELTANNEAGWVSPIGDVEALTADLDRLVSDAGLPGVNDPGARVILAGLFRPDRYDAGTGMNPEELAASLREDGVEADYIPEVDRIVEAVTSTARPGDVLLVMSNGAFGGIHGKLLAALGAR